MCPCKNPYIIPIIYPSNGTHIHSPTPPYAPVGFFGVWGFEFVVFTSRFGAESLGSRVWSLDLGLRFSGLGA